MSSTIGEDKKRMCLTIEVFYDASPKYYGEPSKGLTVEEHMAEVDTENFRNAPDLLAELVSEASENDLKIMVDYV